MRRTPSLLLRAFLFVVVASLVACEGCPGPGPESDAGEDGGTTLPDGGGGGTDGGGGGDDGGVIPDGPIGPLCNQDTLGFGEPCGECGFFVCNPETDELFCYDPGRNDCGGCGDIDTSAGRLNDACGEHGCGVVRCNAEGTATVCEGDHERNVCGGCTTIEPANLGEPCSECGTGTQTCTRDQEQLVCWRGRTPNNACDSCGPCVQYHAYMDERFGGGYLKTGTVAVFEDAGDGAQQMVFLPLIQGAGANALPLAYFFLTNTPEPIFSFPVIACGSDLDCPGTQGCGAEGRVCVEGAGIHTPFAANLPGMWQMADPVRTYSTVGVDVGAYRYLVLYDFFLERVISLGEIVPGPPPGLVVDGGPEPDGGFLDAGEEPEDGGTTGDGVDAGEADAGDEAGADAGDDAGDDAEESDAGDLDGGATDAGELDAGATDAG